MNRAPRPRPWRALALVTARLGPAAAITAVAVAVAPTGAVSAAAPAQVSVFPTAGSHWASSVTQISFRGAPANKLSGVTVVGTRTGGHAGRLVADSDGHGASFIPTHRFDVGETVTVRAPVALVGARNGAVQFTVAVTPPPPVKPTNYHYLVPRGKNVQSFESRPDLGPPAISTLHRGTAAPGDIFIAPDLGHAQGGPMIVSGAGGMIWFQPTRGNQQVDDFRTQTYLGKPVLTWWQGVAGGGHGQGVGMIMDNSYRMLATVQAGNGYAADLHEFLISPTNTAVVVSLANVPDDLSSVGGPRHGTAVDDIIQEIDIPTGNVLFEWHSLDHVLVTDSYEAQTAEYGSNALNRPYDYFHLNSVDVEPDGNLLLSARYTHTLYEIDRHTGAIIWRLGGKHSSFRMGPGTGFAWQHDARLEPNDLITLFNNSTAISGLPATPTQQSSAMVLRLEGHSVGLVHSYVHPAPLLAPYAGSTELLPNGDVFVGWGGTNPYFSEFNAAGRLVFDGKLVPTGMSSYRAYRLPWTGQPAAPPNIAAHTAAGKTTVWTSWNGATTASAWRVFAGPSPAALAPVTTVGWGGFETQIALPAAEPYVAAEALDPSGNVLETSPTIAPAAVR